MAYRFEQFCADNRAAYAINDRADLEIIRLNLERLIQENPDCFDEHCGPGGNDGVVVL